MRYSRYVLRRLLQFVPVIFVVIVLEFTLVHLAPGDVAHIMAGENQDPAYIEAVRHRYGLDQPIWNQFIIYISRILHGDLGTSYQYGLPVLQVIWLRAPATLILVGISLLLSSVLGTLIGALSSRRHGSIVDSTVNVLAVTSYSIPVFWLGLMLVLVFGVWLAWFPTSGMVGIEQKTGLAYLLDVAKHLVLPVITLTAIFLGQYIRLARSAVLEVMESDYVVAARAVGFSERVLMLRYALRNALLPVVTLLGLQLGLVPAGAVLTETVFSWPGLGRLVYQATTARDIPLIMGCYLVMAVAVVLAALITDLVYAALDPRVEYR
jgi:peptide/nickel transport system permease protein